MKSQTKSGGEHPYSREQEKFVSDIADKTMKNFEQAVRTGVKLQEEAAQFWAKLGNQSASAQDLQKRFATAASFANGLVPEAQKRIEEMLALAEKNSRASLELIKKAAEAAQTPLIAESQAKWMEVWTDSIKGAQSNVETLTEIGSRSMNSCIEFVRKNTELAEVRVPKAA
jgi:hypothetical protein